ncbi:Uncharacterized protein BP5553_01646 [Venustampulla echinocandica]|uniref:Alginate lyase 2 domain-containing protein n=1 Tax=Venustampulla echinocandica TaxID=2656787 RepID=A0A370U1L9_9HELO|nr:Uncharacterized protein BP5553_01646 [Venustampulla echinocandica]RDL41667.1 Uncharacterized protein BP5553_01646 [Venustampulla echinocandica]
MSPQISALSTIILLGCAISRATAALDPTCAPGGNFDLSKWNLQLPIGSTGSPTTIKSTDLQGCSGYQDPGHKYFFTESGDGALVMQVPGSPSSSDCVTTKNSLHCRTELRESNPSSWDPNAAKNRLKATVAVTVADDSKRGTVVGQIHIDDSISTKPVCELYYNAQGVLTMGVEKTRAGGDSNFTTIATVPVGTTFSYEIRYETNVLSVSVNGGAMKVLETFDLDAPKSYFKVGNYNQGNSPSDVHVFAISVEH